MPRRKIEPVLKLRNQVAIMLSDIELDKLNRASEKAAHGLGYHYPRARFVKDELMRVVQETLDYDPNAVPSVPSVPVDISSSYPVYMDSPPLPAPPPKPKRIRPSRKAMPPKKAAKKAPTKAVKKAAKKSK